MFKLLDNLVPKLSSPVGVFLKEVDDLPGICLLVVDIRVKTQWSALMSYNKSC